MRRLRVIIQQIVAIVIALSLATLAHAQSQSLDDAIRVSEKVLELHVGQAVQSQDVQDNPEVILRESVLRQSDTPTKSLILKYQNDASVKTGPYKNYLGLSEIRTPDLNERPEYIELAMMAKSSSDLHQAFTANLLLGTLHLKRKQFVLGLDYANAAISIADTLDDGSEASLNRLFDGYGLLQNGLLMDFSINSGLQTSDTLIDLAKATNRRLEPVTMLNNIAAAFAGDDQYDAAIQILQRAEPYIEKGNAKQAFLYNYAMGRFHNGTGDFARAIEYLLKAKTDDLPPNVRAYLNYHLATAYSFSGSIDEVKTLIPEIKDLATNSPLAGRFSLALLKLESRVDASEGNFQTALFKHEAWALAMRASLKDALGASRIKSSERAARSEQLISQKLNFAQETASLKDQVLERTLKAKRNAYIALALLAVILTLISLMLVRQKQNNRRLAESRDQALAGQKAKSDFLSAMSHEVRTPLNAIIPVAELLSRQKMNPHNLALIKIMKSAGESLVSMVDNFCVAASDPSTEVRHLTAYPYERLLMSAVSSSLDIARANAVKVSIDIDAGLRRYSWVTDKSLFKALISNVVENAIKFSQGTPVIVQSSLDSLTGQLSITIDDGGAGIDMDKLSFLRSAFTQDDMTLSRSAEGVGLGLRVADISAQRLKGTVTFRHNNEGGTTVIITLPNLAEPKPAAQAA